MKIIEISEGLIKFDNGTTIEDHHSQDCCEHVYAEFMSLKNESGIMDHEFKDHIIIEGVAESGFRIEGFFVPCYNSQNGYYSSNLSLIIKYPNNIKEEIDVTDFVEDQIN